MICELFSWITKNCLSAENQTGDDQSCPSKNIKDDAFEQNGCYPSNNCGTKVEVAPLTSQPDDNGSTSKLFSSSRLVGSSPSFARLQMTDDTPVSHFSHVNSADGSESSSMNNPLHSNNFPQAESASPLRLTDASLTTHNKANSRNSVAQAWGAEQAGSDSGSSDISTTNEGSFELDI